MMRKNKVLVGCLALLLVLSVGYALFSETITINGTATAKGSFGVDTICEPGFSSDVLNVMGVSSDEIGEGAYKNDTCEVKDNVVTMKAELLYPTAKRYFTVKATNDGSMDAYIPTADIPEIEEELKIYDLETDALKQTIKEGSTGWHDARVTYARIEGEFIAFKLSNGSIIFDLESYFDNNMVYEDSSNNYYLKIAPGETLYYMVSFYWPDGLEAPGEYSVNIGTKILDFRQQTSDLTLSTEFNECLFGCN